MYKNYKMNNGHVFLHFSWIFANFSLYNIDETFATPGQSINSTCKTKFRRLVHLNIE